MREILFRGKSIKTNQWIYGGFHIWEKRQVCALSNNSKFVCGLEYAANNASR